MRHLISFVLLAIATLTLTACNEDPALDTTKDTVGDPLGDVVALNGHIFTTNHDQSGHAGSQVDLFKFAPNGFAVDRFDLGLNATGYLAATTDGAFIYLQKRDTGQLFKVTPVGEIDWTKADPNAGSAKVARGIAHADSFVVLYLEPGTTSYTTLRYGPNVDGAPGSSRTFAWDTFGPDNEVIAITWYDDLLWGIGQAEDGTVRVQGTHENGTGTVTINLDDPGEVCGLGHDENGLFFATTDRQFHSLP